VAPEPDLALEAWTPLGFQVQVALDRWRLITTMKHPVMVGREDAVRVALEQPDQVRESRSDPNVLLFYRQERPGRWTCAIAKRAAPFGFLITAYPTDAIKEGTQIWPK
jgi:hypothetical protein